MVYARKVSSAASEEGRGSKAYGKREGEEEAMVCDGIPGLEHLWTYHVCTGAFAPNFLAKRRARLLVDLHVGDVLLNLSAYKCGRGLSRAKWGDQKEKAKKRKRVLYLLVGGADLLFRHSRPVSSSLPFSARVDVVVRHCEKKN